MLVVPVLVFNACDDDDGLSELREIVFTPCATAAKDAQTAFIEVEDDYTIRFEAGIFDFTNTH
jgi:hypothetical protein